MPQPAPAGPIAGRAPAENQHRRDENMRGDAADENARRESHIAGAAYSVAEKIGHAHERRAGERHVGIGQRCRQHLALSTHCAEQKRPGEQHAGGIDRAARQRQNEGVVGKRIGPIAASGAERARWRTTRRRPCRHWSTG